MQTELIKELNKDLKEFTELWNEEELQLSMISYAVSQQQQDRVRA
ncbi:hypothetical protein [Salmonella enterica]|nr:hypothetical protein [Salmonella enterica]